MTKLLESNEKQNLPIEINFSLNALDIMKLLKGEEYRQEFYLNKKQIIKVKVFSSDRKK